MSVFRLRRARAVAWSPYLIPRSLHGDWWSARDHAISSLMTDDGAGLISSWKGRIAGLEMTASGAARPQYSATGFNGAYPTLSGNGSSVVMNRESTAGLPGGATPGFMAIVGGGFSASDTIVAYGAATSATRQIDTASFSIIRGRAAGVIVSTLFSATIPQITLLICEAGRLRFRQNGSEVVLANTLAAITEIRTRFFASATATPTGTYTAGPLSEVLIGYAWPEQDYLRLEGWAAAEYGIALADGHPYQSGAP